MDALNVLICHFLWCSRQTKVCLVFITPPRLAELCDRLLCRFDSLSFVLSVSRITHDRVNGRRPNMVGVGKG